MNLNLPARVYLPLCTGGSYAIGSPKNKATGLTASGRPPVVEHHVVRFPPHEAAILNSRDRVPYLLYAEVVDCADSQTSSLPLKLNRPRIDDSIGTPERRSDHARSKSLPLVSGLVNDDAEDSIPPVFETGGTMGAAADADEAAQAGQVSVGEIRRRLAKAAREPQVFDDTKDPSAKAFKEPWVRKVERIRQHSPYGHLPNWRLVPVIIKTGDDLRQEHLASQLMAAFAQCWAEEKLSLWLRPLQVLVTTGDGGMIEVVGSAVSLHQIKKHSSTLKAYYLTEFGVATSERFVTAQRNFVESLAGYCLFCYFAQVKDRHNSNILVDGAGHILHIDFGFMLSASNSPGGGLNFESAPFKLTKEYIELLGGWDSTMCSYFRSLILRGFVAARKHSERIIAIVEILMLDSKLPCLADGQVMLKLLKERFKPSLTEERLTAHVDSLIDESFASLRTTLYDRYQYFSNGIL